MGLTLSSLLLLGAVTTYFHLTRSGFRLSNYADIETAARSTLLQFGEDCRAATGANWSDANTLNLATDSGTVTYAFDSGTDSLTRTAAGSADVVARDLNTFSFRAFDINASEINLSANPAAAGGPVKMIQLELGFHANTVDNSNTSQRVASARFVLRNKKVV